MSNQHELYENARSRVKQKKRLYVHFILFVLGSIFFYIANKFLNYGSQYNWYIWAIVVWTFLWVLHAVNVFITHPFMGKEWERTQTEKLILKQELRIAKMEKELAHEAKLKAESEQFAKEVNTPKETQQNNETKE